MLSLCVVPGRSEASSFVDYDKQYDQCLKDLGGVKNATVEACSNATSDDVKTEMNRLYTSLRDRLAKESPDDAAKLEKAQRSWLVYRNSQCELASTYVGSPMIAFCPMKLNIARVHELRELLGNE